MALDYNVKEAIKAKLRLGDKPADVAEALDVKLPTVYVIARSLKAEQENKAVEELVNMPSEVIQHVIEEAKKEITAPPEQAKVLIEELDNVAAGADGLQKLRGSFQMTMTAVLARFDEALKQEDIPLKDVKMISDTVSDAFSKVFSSGTNIHIGDNNNSTQRLTVFKKQMGI